MADLNAYFKSVIDQDTASVVLCDLQHTIIYMNPAAIRNYAKRGGAQLIGRSLLNCHNADSNDRIQQVVDWFAASPARSTAARAPLSGPAAMCLITSAPPSRPNWKPSSVCPSLLPTMPTACASARSGSAERRVTPTSSA